MMAILYLSGKIDANGRQSNGWKKVTDLEEDKMLKEFIRNLKETVPDALVDVSPQVPIELRLIYNRNIL
jgi:DNA-directed RNA polymerase subunit F